MVQTSYPRSAFAGVSYIPGDHTPYTATAAAGQIFTLYYPDGEPSDYQEMNGDEPDRFKLLLVLSLSGASGGSTSSGSNSTASSNPVTSANGFPYHWLRRGGAVAFCQLTSGHVDNSTITGAGFVHLPGGVQGYYESKNRPNQLKDTVLAIQHFRWNTKSYRPSEAASYRVSEKICLFGVNSAFSLPWIGSAPSRACELGSGGPYDMHTCPNFIVATAIYPYNWFIFTDDFESPAWFWPGAETGGAGVDDVPAATIAAAPQRYVRDMGAYQLISDPMHPGHPRVFATSNTAPENTNFGEPHLTDVRLATTGIHDSQHMLMLKQALLPGYVDLRLPPSATHTLSTTQASSTTIPAPYYDGSLTADPAGYVASRVMVALSANPADGEVLVVGDGINSYTLEFDDNATVTAGNVTITIGATAASTMSRINNAIAARNMYLAYATGTPTDTKTLYTSNHPDQIAANFTWTTTAANITITDGDETPASAGLSGGTAAGVSITDEDPDDTSIASAINAAIRGVKGPAGYSWVPPMGIRRKSQVNTTGRFIVPPTPDRGYLLLANLDTTDNLLWGFTQASAVAILAPGAAITIPGTSRIWAKASTDICVYECREMPQEDAT